MIEGAHLTGADLTFAYFTDASLAGASLAGADIRGASLTGATGLTQEQLNSAFGDEKLTPPKEHNFRRPVGWSISSALEKGAHPTDADLMTATGLTQEQLNSALRDEELVRPTLEQLNRAIAARRLSERPRRAEEAPTLRQTQPGGWSIRSAIKSAWSKERWRRTADAPDNAE